MSQISKDIILVDAHVHIYDCFALDVLLDAALLNFRKSANNMGQKGTITAVLLLTETSSYNWFQQVHDICSSNASLFVPETDWSLQATPENTVLQAKPLKGEQGSEILIYIIAGRQIVTAEGLELLALATEHTFEDGLSVSAALTAVYKADAIPVFPWAVGKWLGKRGKVLSALLSREPGKGVFLGDNSGRPIFWHNPSHFKQANELNMPVLPGSDPLPLPGEATRVGSFGFAIQGFLNKAQPATDLKILLRDSTTNLLSYGQLENPWRFFINQIRLRMS